eukprot:TRINITY_DN1903_c0_g1_i7.p1 TRINITY_DN1903_c0_g1~~TRINITY_DN1903_c0_g1_i7.p1  ORF type:complete len:440 (+),score=40.78 TRINITY_DN1903_c0_g1_i7:24-1343(+)
MGESEDEMLNDEDVLNSRINVSLVADNRSMKRNLVGFWILGLINNFAYVIMLSAAHDLLKPSSYHNNTKEALNWDEEAVYHQIAIDKDDSGRDCNPLSTGSILLADVLPAVIIKLVAPFTPISATFKVITTSFLALASFILVSVAQSHSQTFIGVALASLSSGLGEVTFLAYTHKFDPMVLSAWSSGTGGAGILGSGVYAVLTHLGVSPRTAVILMSGLPASMLITYLFILKEVETERTEAPPVSVEQVALINDHHDPDLQHNEVLSLVEKFRIIPGLLKYMIPLGLVYFFEYLINQGLFELMYFPGSGLSHSQQYRWYQFIYSIGVLISRSSLHWIKISQIKILALFQLLNFILALFQSIFWSVPMIWLIFLLIFWEGLLGGAAYVNTFYRISLESSAREKEFSLGVSSLADSGFIGLAGFVSIYLHTWICALPVTIS